MQKLLTSLLYRLIYLFLIAFIVIGGIILLVSNHLYYNAILMLVVPWLAGFLVLGSWQDRLLNSLSLWGWWIYLSLGFAFQWWEPASVIFLGVAILSFAFTKKRTIIHYSAFALVLIYWGLGLGFDYWLPSLIRYILIAGIYVVFYPPLLKKKWRQTVKLVPSFKSLLSKQKNSSN